MKAKWFGTDAYGIRITGDRKQAEPTHVRIAFPGGTVEVTRAKDWDAADYWVHVHVDRLGAGNITPDDDTARIAARVDAIQPGQSFLDCETYQQNEIYHVAFRVKRDRISEEESE